MRTFCFFFAFLIFYSCSSSQYFSKKEHIRTISSLLNNVACTDLDKEYIETVLDKADSFEGKERFISIMNAFLGRRAHWEQADPEKNSSSPKEDALAINLDKLDCVTYSEIVFSLYKSRSWEDFLNNLASIRYYDSKISTEMRFHFPSVDWIPNLLKEHARDITRGIANQFSIDSFKVAGPIDLNKEAFIATFYPKYIEDFQQAFPNEEARLFKNVTLPYIEFDKMWTPSQATNEERIEFLTAEKQMFYRLREAVEVLDRMKAQGADLNAQNQLVKKLKADLEARRLALRLKGAHFRKDFVDAMPDVSLGTMVRPEYSISYKGKFVTRMLVTHHGFVVKKNGKLYFRHASTRLAKKVEDKPFEEYIKGFLFTGSNLDRPENRRSSWRGMHFMGINY